MAPPLAQVSLTLLLVAGLGVGGAVVLVQVTGPVPPDTALVDGGPRTTVGFVTETVELTSENRSVPGSGTLVLPDLEVPHANVTSVSVTFRIRVQGAAASDAYTITVRTPSGAEKTGTHEAAATPTIVGYDQTVPIIDQWSLASLPSERMYETGSEAEALRQSAENHTDRRATGPWQMQIDMTPPPGPTRTATASLLFAITYYEAVAFPVDE